MTFFESLFLGFLQGFTEFVPISSSGHLYLSQVFLELEPSLVFEVFLHGASLLAVLFYFHKDIVKIIRALFSRTSFRSAEGILGWKLLFSTLCTIPVALFFKSFFEGLLDVALVAWMLIVTAFLILIAEKGRSFFLKQKSGGASAFTWKIAFFLGIVQGLAAFPGISRSGITIAFLILLGISRKSSAQISFLLSIPTIAGALVLALGGMDFALGFNEWMGFGMCFGASLLAIFWMIRLIEKHWIWFAPYCFFLGAGLLLWGY